MSSKLIDSFKNATEADLAEVQDKITELKAELASLELIEKVLSVRINGPAPKQPRCKPKNQKEAKDGDATTKSEADRRRISKYLEHSGTAKPAKIARDLDIPTGSITYLLDDPRFRRLDDGVALAL